MRTFVIVAGWLWGLVALPEFTDATVEFGSFLFLFLSGPVIGLLWLGYSAALPSVFRAPRVRWLWLSVPMIGIGCISLSSNHRGLAARVWLCESALREHAEWLRDNPKADPNPQRVGLFWVQSTLVNDGQVYLTTAFGFLDSCGIVYSPDRPPEKVGKHTYWPLYGPWWWFHARF